MYIRKGKEIPNTRKATDMTNQEIFDVLSETYSQLFYALYLDSDNEALKAAYDDARHAFETFAKATKGN